MRCWIPGSHVAGLLVAALLSMLLLSPAGAHPQTQIVYRLAFPFSHGKVKAVDEAWTMDDTTSAQILASFDSDHDGRFDKRESAAMAREILGNLAASGYLTFVTAAGRPLHTMKPFGFRAYVSQKTVILAFGLRFGEEINPARAPLSVSVKDPDFVLDVEPANANLAILKGAPAGCHLGNREAPAGSYPRFALAPRIVTLSCAP